jgi:hypothetical protein
MRLSRIQCEWAWGLTQERRHQARRFAFSPSLTLCHHQHDTVKILRHPSGSEGVARSEMGDIELDVLGRSGAGGVERRGGGGGDAPVDAEGNSLAPNAFGRLLAKTARVGSCAAFPVGACGVLTLCLVFSIGLTVYGFATFDVARDVNPSVEGISPRGTDVGDRDNTLHLLLFNNGGRRDLYHDTGACLSHSPDPDCSGLRRRLEEPAVEPAQRLPAAGNWTLRRALGETAGTGASAASNFCGAPGNGGCDKRQEVIFGARGGGNVLTAPKLVAMCAWEEKVQAHDRFKEYCELGNGSPASPSGCCYAPSLPRVIAAMSDVSCKDLTPALVDAALAKLARCSSARDDGSGVPLNAECAALSALKITAGVDALTVVVGDGPGPDGVWSPTSKHDFPGTCGDFGARCRRRGNGAYDKGLVAGPFGESSSTLEAEWVASSLCLDNGDDDSRDAKHKERDKAQLDYWFDVMVPAYEDEDSPIIGLPNPHGLLIKINQKYIFADLRWAGFSFLLIYLYILNSTRSVMVASFGMMHIFLSFFVTYAIYKSVLVWYPFLLWLGLFVICGIGADDVFVFVDAWRQSAVLLPRDTPLDARISWVHRRAAGAMFITSFTTAGAFLSNAVSSVIPVCLFGLFMCLLVIVNYLAVIGMFPSVVVLDHFLTEFRYANPGSVFAKCRRRCSSSGNAMQGGLDDSLGVDGYDAGAPGGASEFSTSRTSPGSPSSPSSEGFSTETTGDSSDGSGGGSGLREDDFKSAAADLRPVERFFATRWAPLVAKSAHIFAGVFLVVTVLVGFVYTIHLQKATTQVQIWPADYMAVMYDMAEAKGWPELFTTEYGCEPECEDVLFVFGALATDNGRKFHAEWPEGEEHMTFDRGSLVFDDEFSLQSEAAQQWLLDFTANARMLPMFALREEENAVVLPDPQHPVLPPLVLEAAMAPGPIWSVDMAAMAPIVPCFTECGTLSCYDGCAAQPDPAKAVKLGGGCELGPAFAGCFDDYVASAAAGYTPTDAQRTTASFAGIELPDKIEGIDVPTLTYDEQGLRSIGIALHSTLDGSEQGRWDYQTRSASWGLIDRFLKAQTEGVAFSYCSPKSQNIHEMWACNGNEGDGYVQDAAGCGAAGGTRGQCEWLTLPAIGAAPPGLQKGWFHAPWFITTDLQETMVTAALESGAIAVLLAFGCLLSATRSLLMSGIALAAIVSTLVLVIGWLVALGWRLGVLESMCMAISVGICVDFICHCAHAYSHAPVAAAGTCATATGAAAAATAAATRCFATVHVANIALAWRCANLAASLDVVGTRADRVTHALAEMGVSIVSAAVTTFTAAMVLALFTTVVFFTEFGVFLAVCMGCSVTVALAYFPAMLALVGPVKGS